jgi:predicted acylesterase/phospholipase RssA/tetratricopeptide (TPR) repeat protein
MSAEGDLEIGVALSGGGHRATLFSLGVLLYLADSGANRNVTIMSSVSGGSLTNGYVAQECDFSSVTASEFRGVAERLARVIVFRGTVFNWLTWLYLGVLAGLLPVLGWVLLTTNGLSRVMLAFALVIALAFTAGIRGTVVSAAFGRTLFSHGQRRSRLEDIHERVDHVICATDLFGGFPMYFSKNHVLVGDSWTRSGRTKLQTAVQASAAFPGVFPPRRIRLKGLQSWFQGRPTARFTFLVDGGVYNNLATDWVDHTGWHNLVKDLPIEVHDTPRYHVIVNSSSQYRVARDPGMAMRLPVLRELISAPQIMDVLYANTVAPRLERLRDKMYEATMDQSAEGPIPVVVQIGNSPSKLAHSFNFGAASVPSVLARVGLTVTGAPPPPEALARAHEVTRFFESRQPAEWWNEEAERVRTVPTTLNRIELETARLLIHHGYTLAMAVLHTFIGTSLTPRVLVDEVLDSVLRDDRVADVDFSDAMYNLGVLHMDQDRTAAEQWFKKAAEMGHLDAMNNLGGLLMGKDREAAKQWFKKAADVGHAQAMNNLGLLLQDEDREAARQWIKKAADKGDARAMYNLGVLLEGEDRESARLWYEKAAEKGHANAMCNLGLLLKDQDRETARLWFEEAAGRGHAKAMHNLGVLLMDEDREAAKLWFERAAQKGYAEGTRS